MSDESFLVAKATPGRGRKRLRQVDTWKRSREKRERYSASFPPEYPKCKHNSKALQCSTLQIEDIREFNRAFYITQNKLDQDNFIIKHCITSQPKRRRIAGDSKRCLTFTYHVRKKTCGSLIPVCRDAFLSILGLKKDRVQGVLRRSHISGGQTVRENRGGDRKSVKNKSRREAIGKYIESLKCTEPHYCRSRKSDRRLYLPPELNIKKLWRMYNTTVESELKVKECFFRQVFCTNYNIGFGSPRTDVCSVCLELGERLKVEKTTSVKQQLMTEKRIHKLKASAFYDMLREERQGLLIVSYDCQKNMLLPKLPDQAAYFSRQYNFYNFTVVSGSSRSPLSKQNVHCYCWNESDRSKGSNEIASCVYHRLKHTDMQGIDTVRLVADGCGGQNKNSSVIAMASKWLYSDAPHGVSTVEIIFPVVGHSFIPPDRVFARIEKVLKKKEVVVEPTTYENIISEHGTLHKLGSDDVQVYNWKSEATKCFKNTGSWHFKFNQSKRFYITKTRNNIKIRGEYAYKIDLGVPKYITKKGKTVTDINPTPIVHGNIALNPNKVSDVGKLLAKHYGQNWRDLASLSFYSRLESVAQEQSVSAECDEQFACEDFNEVPILIV